MAPEETCILCPGSDVWQCSVSPQPSGPVLQENLFSQILFYTPFSSRTCSEIVSACISGFGKEIYKSVYIISLAYSISKSETASVQQQVNTILHRHTDSTTYKCPNCKCHKVLHTFLSEPGPCWQNSHYKISKLRPKREPRSRWSSGCEPRPGKYSPHQHTTTSSLNGCKGRSDPWIHAVKI